MLKRLDRFFEACPRNGILFLTLLSAVGVGVLDYFAAPDLLVLYLGPLFVAAWYGGRSVGSAVAIYSSGSAFVTSTWMGPRLEPNQTALLNLLVQMVAYVLIAYTVSRLRESRRAAGFIVHDVRSPISNAISGLLALKECGDHLEEGEREMLDLALTSSQSAVLLVNSLLDIAKLESGKMEVKPEDVELEKFLDGCWSQVELSARQYDIRLEKDLQVHSGRLDPGLTERVIVNLLTNAVKFSPPEAVVTLRTSLHHHSLRIDIADQGPGIPKDLAKSVFQPFVQADGEKAGTGLGLTFCRLAVQAQHGNIWVDGTTEDGTTITFTIPQPTQAKRHREPLPQPSQS